MSPIDLCMHVIGLWEETGVPADRQIVHVSSSNADFSKPQSFLVRKAATHGFIWEQLREQPIVLDAVFESSKGLFMQCFQVKTQQKFYLFRQNRKVPFLKNGTIQKQAPKCKISNRPLIQAIEEEHRTGCVSVRMVTSLWTFEEKWQEQVINIYLISHEQHYLLVCWCEAK